MSVYTGLMALFIIAWLLVGIGWQGWKGLRLYYGAPKRRTEDVSHLGLRPPLSMRPIMAALEELGFHRLGEAQVSIPHRKPAAYWVLVDADGVVQAEAGFGRVSFSTYFGERSLAVTDYPNGENIDTPTYQSHTILTGVEDAYVHHKAQVEKLTPKFGLPHTLASMADYARWEAVGRTYYSLLKLRRFFYVDVARVAVFVYGALVLAGLPFIWMSNAVVSASLNRQEMQLLALGLTLPAIFIPPLLSKWVLAGSRRDSRSRAQ